MGRRNKRRWVTRFQVLNQRIWGLNVLWGGWNKAKDLNHGVHWGCADENFKFICRKILQWSSGFLTVPPSMQSYAAVTCKKGIAYEDFNPGMIDINEVKAELVALPSEPPNIIPILSLLPKIWREHYETEESVVSNEESAWLAMRNCKPKLGMKRDQYVKLIKKLLQLGMVVLLPLEKVRVVNGLHCVTKNAGKQRMIFDGRPVNYVIREPDKVSLPDFSLLADWEIGKGEIIRFGKLDLDNYYHRLGVPGWLVPFLGLPVLDGRKVGGKEGWFSPACLTLPMGLSYSVILAQLSHLFVLRNISIAPQINAKVKSCESMWAMLYIDDVLIAAKAASAEEVNFKVNSILHECLECYKEVGLVINPTKLEWAKTAILGLGCTLSEDDCGIVPKKERLMQVIAATKFMMTLDMVAPKTIEFLLGHWTWFVLLYHPLYSVFFHVYKWLHADEEGGVRKLWKSVKREFALIIIFADVCKMSWRRNTTPVVLAMDASLAGAGACESEWSMLIERENGEEDIPLKEKGVWNKSLNRQWGKMEHINVLEMRALTMSLLPRIAILKFWRMKWRIFSDSLVVVGAEKKLNQQTVRRFTVGLAKSTVRTYAAALANFKNKVGEIRFSELDSQLLDYVQSFPSLSQRSVTERISCACMHFFPEVTGNLPRLNRFAQQLRRQYKSLSKPPMIWDVVVLVVCQLLSLGYPLTALGTLLQYDCFLRPAELAAIQTRHIALPGGNLLGSKAKNMLLLLPKAKTGPLQSVRVKSKVVRNILAKVVKNSPARTLLFPSVTVYRKRVAKALEWLGLEHIGYTPHSIRHGAATIALINKGEKALPAIMYRGRWESSAGKAYLQMGAAALLYAEIPTKLIKRAKEKEKILPKLFQHFNWNRGH